MVTRTRMGGRPAALVTVLLLAGCAGLPGPAASPAAPAASPAAPAIATASVSAASAPSAPSDRVLVGGEMTCVLVEADVVATPGSGPSPTPEPTPVPPGLVYVEHDQLDCTYEMSDSRVSGTERFDSMTSVVELPDLPGLARMWDNVPVTLDAEGGTWKGCTAGSEFVRLTTARMWTTGSARYDGQGAFDGLSYTVTFTREARRGDEPYLVSGWIEPATVTETGGCIIP